jgi:integrase
LKWEHVDAIIASRIDRPGACWNLMIALRGLIKYCQKAKMITDDPTRGIERPPLNPDGRATWNEEHIAAFEKAYPIGTQERLALALALYTALRREDLIIVGPGHISDGILYICPQKTRNKTGITLAIPVHPELASVLEQTPTKCATFLKNARGEPFTADVFTSWFRGVRKAAGLPEGLSVHGLRKAACRRLAEARCTPHEIMAISGHTTLKEVERYTRAAERARMARSAIETVTRAFSAKVIPEVPNGNPSGLGVANRSLSY